MISVKLKSQSNLRWLILFLNCIMMIGNYYCYDIPAALHTQLRDYTGAHDNFETMFSLLYTVYSIPNIILPFFGGYFVDKLGVRICLLVFVCLITIGQIVFALGVSTNSWTVMLIGRVIYGFGGESLGVGNSALLSEWFKGKEVAFAFGLNLSIARLGSVINNLVSPSLAKSAGIDFALWFGAILCGLSVFCVVCIGSIDRIVEAQINEPAANSLLTTDDGEEEEVVLSAKLHDQEPEVKFRDVLTFSRAFWILAISCVVVYGCVLPFNNIASSLLLERDYFKANPSDCSLAIPTQCQTEFNKPISSCPSSTWYQPPLPLNASVGGEVYDPLDISMIDCTSDVWTDGCTEIYCSRQADAVIQAGTIMSIPYIISACLSPFLGGFVDRFGMRAVIATIAPLALMIVHLILGLTTVNPIGPLVGQGLSYAMFAAVLWPSVPLVVEQRFIGLGYGIVTSIQNGGLAAFPLIIAAIYVSAGDHYIPTVEMFFVGLAALGVVVGLYLNYYDYYNHHVFNSPKGHHTHAVGVNASYDGIMTEEDAGANEEEEKLSNKKERIFADALIQ